MRFPVSSCPVSYGLSGMDRRQNTSRNDEENGANDAANAHSTTINPQRSPPIVQRPTLPLTLSQEGSSANIGRNLAPCGSFPAGDEPFINFVRPWEDTWEALSQSLLPQLDEGFNSPPLFAGERGYDPLSEEIVEDNESATHEAPASEAPSYAATLNAASPKRKRDIPLTEEEKKERNREYSKRYRRKQNLKTKERNIELERAKYWIKFLAAHLTSRDVEIQRLVQLVSELEAEIRTLREPVTDLDGFPNPCFFENEAGHGNLDARDSYWSDNLNTDLEYSSEYLGAPDDFQSRFQS